MKVYLAGPYQARDLLAEYADELRLIGFEVTSSWLKETTEINDGTTGAATALDDATVAVHAATDLRDIERADIVVAFTAYATGATGHSGGRHVETGYAIGLGKHVLVVGEPENVFHRLASRVSNAVTWHEALIWLAAELVAHYRDAPQAVAS